MWLTVLLAIKLLSQHLNKQHYNLVYLALRSVTHFICIKYECYKKLRTGAMFEVGRFQASVAKYMRIAFFCVVTQRVVVIAQQNAVLVFEVVYW